MKKLQIKKKIEKDKSEWWQLAGKELSAFFGKNVYWVFWRFSRDKIDRAYQIAQKEQNKDLTHFLNNCKKP